MGFMISKNVYLDIHTIKSPQPPPHPLNNFAFISINIFNPIQIFSMNGVNVP